MIYQIPHSYTKNLFNENIFPSQSLMLNQNYTIKNKFCMETPQHSHNNNNNLNIYNDYYIENSFNKDTNYKGISGSIKAELKHSSDNLVNLITTPQFEKICLKIFFPKDDPFHLSSSKKSPNKKEIKKNNIIKSPILIEKENIININNNINNTNCNQSTKRKQKPNLPYSQTKKNKFKNNFYSTDKSSKCSDIKRNFSKKIKNEKYINNNRFPIKRNRRYINELKSLIKDEKININICNDICSSVWVVQNPIKMK